MTFCCLASGLLLFIIIHRTPSGELGRRLFPLIVELAVSIIELVLWGEVISPTSNPQPGGSGFFCRGFPSLSHRFQLVEGAGYSPFATAAQLLKASPGATKRGRATYDFAGRACVLREGVSQHLGESIGALANPTGTHYQRTVALKGY